MFTTPIHPDPITKFLFRQPMPQYTNLLSVRQHSQSKTEPIVNSFVLTIKKTMNSLSDIDITAEHLTAAAVLSAAVYEQDVVKYIGDQKFDHNIALVSATDESATQHFLIAQSVDAKTIYVCFRGTDNWKDILADSKFQMANSTEFHGSFHGGFHYRSQHFHPKLIAPYLDQNKKIIFCGHSMGGAVAAICCMHMMAKQSSMERKKLMYTIGFGTPMFTDASTKMNFETKVAEMNTKLPNHYMFFMHSSDVVPASMSLLQHVCSQFDVRTLKLKEGAKFPIDLSYWESIKQFFSAHSSDIVGCIKYILTEFVGVNENLLSCVGTVWKVLKYVYQKAAQYILRTLSGIKYSFIGQLFLVDKEVEFIKTEMDLNDIQSTFESFFKNEQLSLESKHIECHRMRNYIHNLMPSLLKTEQKRTPAPFEDVLLPQHLVYDYDVMSSDKPENMKDKVICQLGVNRKHLSVIIDHTQCVVKRIDIAEGHKKIKRAKHSPTGTEAIFLVDEVDCNAMYTIVVSGLFNTRTYDITLKTLNELGGFRKKQLKAMDPITLMYYVFRMLKSDKMMIENEIFNCKQMKFRISSIEKHLKKLLTDSVFEKFKDLPDTVTEDNSWLMWKGQKETTFNEYFTKLFNELFPALPWSILKKALVGVGVAGGATVGVALGAFFLPLFLVSAGNAVSGGVFSIVCGTALLGAGGGATSGLLISKVSSISFMNVKFLEHYIKYLNYIAQEMDLVFKEGMTLADMENHIFKNEVVKYLQNNSLKLTQVGCVRELRKLALSAGTRVAVMEVKKEDAALFCSKMCKQQIFQQEGEGYLTSLQPTPITRQLFQNGAFDVIYVPISYQDLKERSVDLSLVKEALSSADVLSIVFCIHNCNASSIQELEQMQERENVWSRLGYDHDTLRNHIAKKIYYMFLNYDEPNYEQGVFDEDIAFGFVLDLVKE